MKITFAIVVIIAAFYAWQVYATANCTATGAGRYPEPNDTTCQNYTLCVFVSANSTYLAYDYVCPTTSLFNPNSQQCTSTYNCTTT